MSASLNSATPTNCNDWHLYLSNYVHAITLLSKEKKKPILIELDTFWHREFPLLIQSRSMPYMNLHELSKIMSWKLTRGKMRPLQKLLDSNNPKTVEIQSKKAFQLCQTGQWKDAMIALMELKAVGPATASAILAPLFPCDCPFMADEVLEEVSGKREYTMQAYETMRTYLLAKAIELTRNAKEQGKPYKWTAEEVGRAIWSHAVLKRVGSNPLPSTTDPLDSKHQKELPSIITEEKVESTRKKRKT